MSLMHKKSIDRLIHDLNVSSNDISKIIENSNVYFDESTGNKDNLSSHYRFIDITSLQQRIANLEFILKQIKKIRTTHFTSEMKMLDK